jgi:hypothetical protein
MNRKRGMGIRFFQSNHEYFFLIAILIVIENLIWINQTVVENFQADFDLFFSITSWLENFQQTLIEKQDSGAVLRLWAGH